jgi:pimeloyl-ACP methyl ester carboxylesterase
VRLAAVLLIASCAACNRTPDRPEPIVTPLPIVTPIDEPYVATSFTTTVRGHGRPVILIPGLGCPGSVWDATVAHLSSYSETHVVELAGFAGRPAIPGPLEATARVELAHYIKQNHLDRPVIIGHSLGGFLALWLASTDPGLVGPTIVVDAAPAIGNTIDPEAARQISDTWRSQNPNDFADSVRDFFTPMALDARTLSPFIPAVARSDRRAFADAFDELFSTDLRPQIASIRAPVLFVLSEISPADELRTETAPILNHEIVVLPNTRHFLFLDDPVAWFDTVDRFLLAHPTVTILSDQPAKH